MNKQTYLTLGFAAAAVGLGAYAIVQNEKLSQLQKYYDNQQIVNAMTIDHFTYLFEHVDAEVFWKFAERAEKDLEFFNLTKDV